jgi:hypothetical protein
MLEHAEDETDVLLARAIALLVQRREARRAEKTVSGLGVESSEKGCFGTFSGQSGPDQRSSKSSI